MFTLDCHGTFGLMPENARNMPFVLSSIFTVNTRSTFAHVLNVLNWFHGCVSYTLRSPGLRMQLQVGLISFTAVTRGKMPLPLLVEYIESR